ncbi:MAG: methyltransferase domain-containing protein [Planctomycetes bacterium]|nr:methyltransferase domain-containing protein [Planctomycetota bacterium]
MKLPLPLLFVALLALAACKSSPPPAALESVKPGINKDFLDPALDPQKFVERFETESREIFTERAAIAALVGLKPGQRVADIGAGTGLFTLPFAQAVGERGRVYAVDIAPAFVERIEGLAAEHGLRNVEGVVCAEDDARLPKGSIDVAFVCDTYHHFEYPTPTLASIHRALRQSGELVVIDFHRIEGVSREWCMSHVRAGQDVFVAEITAAGFEQVAQEQLPGLKENYIVRFRKR